MRRGRKRQSGWAEQCGDHDDDAGDRRFQLSCRDDYRRSREAANEQRCGHDDECEWECCGADGDGDGSVGGGWAGGFGLVVSG